MNRRAFMGLGALGAGSCRLVAEQIAQRIESPALRFIDQKRGRHPFRTRPAANRPNIFLLTMDMVPPDHYHPAHSLHREMELPAMRSLFRDGAVFQNAFCASPLCAPARAVLATGRYTYITANGERSHDGHETILRPDDVIFQEYLKATGYITKHCGKGHLGTQKFIDAFDENVNAWDRWDPPVHSDEEYLSYLSRLHVKPQRYRRELRGMQQDRQTPSNSFGGWIEQSDGRPFPLEAQYSQFLAHRAVEKLDAALLQREGDAPIYLQLDLFDPHQPFSIPEGFERREKALRAAFQLPDSYKEVRARDWKPDPGLPKIYNFYAKYWGLYDEATVRDYRVADALQVEVADHALGIFLKALKDRGLYDDALIIFTSDHGEMNGRRAVVDKGVYLYPEVLRVPLAVKMPARSGIKPRTVEAPVSHLDIAPTLLSLTGIEPEARLDGQSLMPYLDGTGSPTDRDFLFECGWHVGVNFACGIQRWQSNGNHHLYTYNLSSTVDELYDLNSIDPANLAQSPEHAKLHAEMIQKLGTILEKDPRWLGYWHSFRLDHYFDLPKPKGDLQIMRR